MLKSLTWALQGTGKVVMASTTIHPPPDKVFDGEPSRTEKGCASPFHLADTQQNTALGEADSGGSS